MYIKLL
ncbi:hypothetical protein EC3006_0392, partial [Escherichia coli 3006]